MQRAYLRVSFQEPATRNDDTVTKQTHTSSTRLLSALQVKLHNFGSRVYNKKITRGFCVTC